MCWVSEDKDLAWDCLLGLDGAVYLEEASHWDSHRIEGQNRTRVMFSTTRRQTAEVMQAMAATSGIPSNMRYQASRAEQHSDLWHLSYPLGSLPRWRASWSAVTAGKQTVYCVQVSSGALLVRRSGRVTVMGNCNFGLLYGMGATGFAQYAKGQYGMDLPEKEARGYRQAFFKAYPGLASWHRKVGASTSTQTRTLTGRRRLDVHSYTKKLNSPVQGTGADGLKLALALLWERRAEVPGAFPVLTVHDEIVIECAADQAEAVRAWLQRAMLEAMEPLIAPVPVEVSISVGTTWAGD
jgi:DNA polymerase-1